MNKCIRNKSKTYTKLNKNESITKKMENLQIYEKITEQNSKKRKIYVEEKINLTDDMPILSKISKSITYYENNNYSSDSNYKILCIK